MFVTNDHLFAEYVILIWNVEQMNPTKQLSWYVLTIPAVTRHNVYHTQDTIRQRDCMYIKYRGSGQKKRPTSRGTG